LSVRTCTAGFTSRRRAAVASVLKNTGIRGAKQQLAGQVADIDAIEIIDQQMADARVGQIQAGDRAQSTEPDDQGAGLPEPLLALDAKAGAGRYAGRNAVNRSWFRGVAGLR
jgi:hypothetical protein